jgi:hypothetical protein
MADTSRQHGGISCDILCITWIKHMIYVVLDGNYGSWLREFE